MPLIGASIEQPTEKLPDRNQIIVIDRTNTYVNNSAKNEIIGRPTCGNKPLLMRNIFKESKTSSIFKVLP